MTESERNLATWSSIVLTTERVVGPARRGGQLALALDCVEWAGVRKEHQPRFMVAAATCCVLAAPAAMLGGVVGVFAGGAFLACGLVLGLMYLATQRTYVSIGAGSGVILQVVTLDQRNAALVFCRTVLSFAQQQRRRR